MSAPERVIVLWLPDWPVTAHLRTRAREIGAERPDPDAPIAVMHANRVVACSAAARAEGVRRGQRRRDAQAACARLVIVRADDERDARAFHRVLAALEELAPGIEPLRPGLAALRARGPSRFYRGEEPAARALVDALEAEGVTGARAGVADGVFTAEQAARAASAPVSVVPPGEAGRFLAPLPVQALGDDDVAALFVRLGVRTLGDVARLDPERVRERLGFRGLRLQRLAAGLDSRPVVPRIPPPELAREIAFEPALEIADQVAFAVRQTADAFVDGVAAEGLVITAVRVTIEGDLGGRSERVWQHPATFDAASVVDRVRWQLERDESDGGVALVRLEPEAVDDGSAHQPALVGQGPDDRAHHAMTRVQAALGHRGVVTPVLGGGRWLAERETDVPWGDARTAERRRDEPWPGSLPDPLPAEVFRPPRPARVTGEGGAEVAIDDRGFVTAEPAAIGSRAVTAWAGPWPVVERGWDAAHARRAWRFQLVDDAGSAWLAVREGDGWWLEGRYA
ncbi:DNA polymerase Y family protein [Microbacterium indicum]|uniref:DNA polymerase Y family protein n=1 Tax=Microbacterium indicum TaxID=358100 RepID=UPI0003F62668|nr:DNA polymerase Y family protein [Microbacterium indicum]